MPPQAAIHETARTHRKMYPSNPSYPTTGNLSSDFIGKATDLIGELYQSLSIEKALTTGAKMSAKDRAFYLLYLSAAERGYVYRLQPGQLPTLERIKRALRESLGSDPGYMAHLFLLRALDAKQPDEAQLELNAAAKWVRWETQKEAEHPATGEAVYAGSLRSVLDFSFIYRVTGDQYEPDLSHGDVVFIREATEAEEKDLVFARMIDATTGNPITICRRMSSPEGFPELARGEAVISGIVTGKVTKP